MICLADSELVDSNGDGAFEIDQTGKAQYQITRHFYQSHPHDIHQFLTLFSASALRQEGITPQPLTYLVKNNTVGLGLQPTDNSVVYGNSNLETIINMRSVAEWPSDPTVTRGDKVIGAQSELSTVDAIGHELLHRWAAYVRFTLPGETSKHTELLDNVGKGHWSFLVNSTPASVLYGNSWALTGTKVLWQPFNVPVVQTDVYTVTGVTQGYSPLDLYLMGLYTKDETRAAASQIFYIEPTVYVPLPTAPAGSLWCGNALWAIANLPCDKGLAYGSRHDVSIDEIVQAEGDRIPAARVPQTFHQAFVLLARSGQTVSKAEIDQLEAIRRAFETWFAASTSERGILDTSL